MTRISEVTEPLFAKSYTDKDKKIIIDTEIKNTLEQDIMMNMLFIQ